jgi:radical SAM superfamily enzyme YgiQ (UPF0313 family)
MVKKKSGSYGNVLTDMPLGVMSLSSYVKKNSDTKTALIDFNVLLNKLDDFNYKSFFDFFDDVISSPQWLNYHPSVIGISTLFTPAYQNMLDIGKCCREKFPDAIITAGGGVPTNMYREIFKHSDCFDALCYGEGELPLLNLVNAIDKKKYLDENLSWITHDKVKNNVTFNHTFIDNLDEIPFYDYDILVPEDYGINPAITAYASIGEKKQNFHVMTSRGCTHHCCFCSSHTVHGRKMRYYSVERIQEDFARLKNNFSARTLIFQDDHFMGDKHRALRIIEVVKEMQFKIVFQNSLALYALDRKMLESLKSAGVNQLLLSVESGSERVLREIMHKPLNLSIVKRVAKDCRELNIYTNVNILIGLPGETKEDIEDTRAFLKTIDANWFLIFCANPLVGSEMLQTCLKNNYLKGDYIGSDYKRAVVETEDFSADYIQEKSYLLNLELNFIENSDFRLGDYQTALMGFENAIRAKSDHAIAYYCASNALKKLGDINKSAEYMDKAKTIIKNSVLWRNFADIFNIDI